MRAALLAVSALLVCVFPHAMPRQLTASPSGKGASRGNSSNNNNNNATTNNVLVVFYSFTPGGCTERMAREVANGAAAANASVKVQRVNETSCQDVAEADALIVGSPVHFANPASDIIRFFEDLQNVCFGWPLTALEKKVGGAFADGGGESKGKDTTMQAIVSALLALRMVVRGCNDGTCNEWGAAATNLDHPGQPAPPLTADEVAGARDLGAKIAELSAIIWHSH
jgi:NAD(P)H dehydrogenase (quinone)